MKIEKIPLKRINLELTNRCNLHCNHCGDKKTRPVDDMNVEFIATFLSNLLDEDKKGMYIKKPEIRLFLSGEPLCYFPIKLLAILSFIDQEMPGFPVLIHTNGTLWSQDTSLHIANMKNIKLVVSFSLDGMNSFEYFKIRNVDYFDIVSSNIDNFLKILKIKDNKNIKVTVQSVVDSDKSLEDMLLHREKLFHIFTGANVYVRKAHNWNTLDEIKMAEKKTYGALCDFMMHDLAIYSNWSVGLCCACLNEEISFGNFFLDFSGSPYAAFMCEGRENMRQAMKRKDTLIVCSSCERYGA